jgi:integrase
VAHRRLYDCRHTFATWAIESGVELWYLARVMGTSTVQIEDTYARWLKLSRRVTARAPRLGCP